MGKGKGGIEGFERVAAPYRLLGIEGVALFKLRGQVEMASKSNKAKLPASKEKNKGNGWLSLVAIPTTAFVIKIIIMANIDSGGWLGADGESYLDGVNSLLTQGYFSQKDVLAYWPAGYPIFIWLLCKISIAHAIWLISFFQSIFYALACFFFVKQVSNTRFSQYTLLIGSILAINPTLSLSSLVVGYESAIASCMLMIVGIILKSKNNASDGKLLRRVACVGLFSAMSVFMQPRWIAITFLIAIVWAFMFTSRKTQSVIILGVIGFMAIAPVILIQRNIEATNKAVVSTNLGVTMRLGAGESTSGSYVHSGPEIPCESEPAEIAPRDSQVIKCVLTWYAKNPTKAVHLFINKSWYFWSPWSGPLSNGTMARNPWLKINPIISIAQGSQTGNDLIYKSFGQIVSVLWEITGILLLFIGFFALRNMKNIYTNLAYLSFLPVVGSWIISMATIGDHRYRIPTMPLSLFLQLIGILSLRHKIKKGSYANNLGGT